MEPFKKFQTWYQKEMDETEESIPSACCLSTSGEDGYPNARFVSLKEVINGQFIVTGPMNSRKGEELQKSPRAALTFWWPSTEKQVRIQGDAHPIDTASADRYFSERSRESQIVSWVSDQGKPVENTEIIHERFNRFSEMYSNKKIPRPANWGGFKIIPVRIEFLSFQTSRFHERLLYIKNADVWEEQIIQP